MEGGPKEIPYDFTNSIDDHFGNEGFCLALFTRLMAMLVSITELALLRERQGRIVSGRAVTPTVTSTTTATVAKTDAT